jgi:hypothetical protein
MGVYESQTRLLECLRDIWPAQKGLAALLFQDDLFLHLRRLEVKTEGGDAEDAMGFLPEGFPEWSGGTEEYAQIWAALEKEAILDANETLDALEDAVCGWVEDMIPENCAFFEAALDNGYLDEKWLHAAQMLLALEQPKAEEEPVKEPVAVQLEETAPIASVTIEPIVATLVLAPEPRPRLPTRRLRRAGRPLTPSLRRKARHTRRNKVLTK